MNNLIKKYIIWIYWINWTNKYINFLDKQKRSLLFVVWFDKVRNQKLIKWIFGVHNYRDEGRGENEGGSSKGWAESVKNWGCQCSVYVSLAHDSKCSIVRSHLTPLPPLRDSRWISTSTWSLTSLKGFLWNEFELKTVQNTIIGITLSELFNFRCRQVVGVLDPRFLYGDSGGVSGIKSSLVESKIWGESKNLFAIVKFVIFWACQFGERPAIYFEFFGRKFTFTSGLF